MIVIIRFLGVLSQTFKLNPVLADIEPNYSALHQKVSELAILGKIESFTILKNGISLNEENTIIEENDEFNVFFPISGG